jgi:hypothetical protein
MQRVFTLIVEDNAVKSLVKLSPEEYQRSKTPRTSSKFMAVIV